MTSDEHWRHLEALLAELYRREIESEENIWRSLPFFSATLALEVAVVGQAAPAILATRGVWGWVAAVAAGALVLLALAVLFFLYRSIRVGRFAYIASEPRLVTYLTELEEAEDGEGDETVLLSLRRALISQYAAATPHNRHLNQRRTRARSRAGALLLASIVATLAVVGATVAAHLIGGGIPGDRHGESAATRSDPVTTVPGGRSAPAGAGGATAAPPPP